MLIFEYLQYFIKKQFKLLLLITYYMIDVQKKVVKTIDDYRHSIKLLKYNLKKEKKANEKLKYQSAKFKHKPQAIQQARNRVYELSETIKLVSDRLKRMGLILEDLFRMADTRYQGEITKQQFMKVVSQLKIQLNDSIFTEMFYSIDTSLNNLVSQDEYLQFSIAYGGCSDIKEIRKYQNKIKTKLLGLIKKTHGSLEQFLSKLKDPIQINQLSKQLRGFNLNSNEVMIMLKTFDPTHQGFANHKFILSIMQSAKQKTQREQENQEITKNVNQLCVMLRDKKINPIQIYEQADVDGEKGVSPFELEQAFKKIVPDQTPFQIKKWVSLINYNNDKIITKEQFINAVRGFYSINQIDKFSQQYAKKHPQLKIQESNQSTQKILKQLNIAIQDKGLTRKQAFDFFDFNKSNDIDKQQLIQGLKSLGLNIGFIHRVIAIFDTNNSQKIQKEEWMRILGEDPVMSEVPDEQDLNLDSSGDQQNNKNIKNIKPKQNQNQKVVAKQEKNKKKSPEQIKKDNSKNSPVKITKKIEEKPKMKVNQKQKQKQKKKQVIKQNTSSKQNKMNKKFAEDQNIKNKNDKIDKSENKKIKNNENKPLEKKKLQQKKQKQVKKQEKNKESQKQDIQIDQEQMQDVSQIQEQIGQRYKKNKKEILKYFREYDPKQKQIINKTKFSEVLKKIIPSITSNQINQIFMKSVVNGNQFRYKQWLEQIATEYGQQIASQNNPSQSEVNHLEDQLENEGDQTPDKNEITEQKMKVSKEKQQVKEKVIEKEKVKQIEKQKQNGEQQKKKDIDQKRGQSSVAFEILASTLKIVQGKKIDSGYKLIDYISDEQNQLQKIRQELLQKALQIKKKGDIFEDKSFPPNKKSIYSGKTQCHINNQSLLKWKHYKKIFKNPQLFHGTIEPNDIRQGSLGDCYFLSGIAGLAQYINLIERLFQYHDLDTGYFLIWLCINGSWKLVEVDGYLPVRQPDEQLAFSHSQFQQLWVSLIQKAYAKCYGEYNNIVGGQPIQAIKDLTGSPGKHFQFKKFNQDQVWQMLIEANKNQYIMTAGTKLLELEGKVEGHQESVTNNGIVLGHAYSILDCRVFKKQKILKLRNPWGQIQWTGSQWSDNSKKWTKQAKKQLNHEINQKDGIFWIQLQQFYKNFMACSISYIRPTFYYRSDKIPKVQSFIVIITNPFNTGYISINHRDHRELGLEPNTPYDGIYKLMGFVYNKGQVVQKFQQKSFLYERQGCVQFEGMNKYPQGFEAITLVKLFKTTDVTVSFYGDTKSDFRIQSKYQNYLQKLAYYQQRGKETKIDKENKIKIWKCQIQGILYICFKNIGDKVIKLKVQLEKLENMKPVPPQSMNERLKLVPDETKNIKLKILNYPPKFSYGYMIQP